MNELTDKLFEDEIDVASITDGEEIVHIDTEEIDRDALEYAEGLVKTLSSGYFDENFLNANPNIRKRLAAEVESLKILIRMRKSDEQVHDIALKAVCGNSGNASLYRALHDTQKNLISIQDKIDGTVDRITNMLKNYQLEINFPEDDAVGEGDDDGGTHFRGSKNFIEYMNAKKGTN